MLAAVSRPERSELVSEEAPGHQCRHEPLNAPMLSERFAELSTYPPDIFIRSFLNRFLDLLFRGRSSPLTMRLSALLM